MRDTSIHMRNDAMLKNTEDDDWKDCNNEHNTLPEAYISRIEARMQSAAHV